MDGCLVLCDDDGDVMMDWPLNLRTARIQMEMSNALTVPAGKEKMKVVDSTVCFEEYVATRYLLLLAARPSRLYGIAAPWNIAFFDQ